jgi:hypothetical protein
MVPWLATERMITLEDLKRYVQPNGKSSHERDPAYAFSDLHSFSCRLKVDTRMAFPLENGLEDH